MTLKITIDNYEEIMFRLLENDFDEPTRINLLQQIESDALFKFEWQSWQKTKFVDPLENYVIESRELTEKIILIAEPETAGRKQFLYYWAAAASFILLIGSLFLLSDDFTSNPKPEAIVNVTKPVSPEKSEVSPAGNVSVSKAVALMEKNINHQVENQVIRAEADSNMLHTNQTSLAETPIVIDSASVKTPEIVQVSEKKSRFKITVETSDISGPNQQNNMIAQREKVKMNKVFTNTKIFLRRKPDGEPDKIILLGVDNSFVCLNLNY